MNAQTEIFLIQGPIGTLECALDQPDPDLFPQPRGIALVGHPHPLFGGTMDNKVAQTLARTFVGLGYITARMNFRGVGQSQGEHDAGVGETDDMEVLSQHLRQQYPNLPLVLGGFSFGSFVQSQLHQRLQEQGIAVERLVLIGTPAGKWPMPNIPDNAILIHGELDETIPLQAVFDWLRPQDIPVLVMPGADHFFHRRLPKLKHFISLMWTT
jgi:alpha/beta superfamily hydrolase